MRSKTHCTGLSTAAANGCVEHGPVVEDVQVHDRRDAERADVLRHRAVRQKLGRLVVRDGEHGRLRVELVERVDARLQLHVDAGCRERALRRVAVQLLQRHGRVADVGRAGLLEQPDLEHHRRERERRPLASRD